MGRASDRFGNRRHPLFRHAKELVNVASKAVADGDAGGLAALLDAKLDTLAADGFEDVIGMATLELRQRKNASEAVQLLVTTTLEVSERGQREADGLTAQLFGVVFRCARDMDLLKTLSEDQLLGILQCMVQHRLLAARASVTLLPLLLSPRQAQALLAGDVYAVTRYLLNGDGDAARQVVEQREGTVGSTDTSGKTLVEGSVALLVGVAGAADGEVFPVSDDLARQAEMGAAQGLLAGAGYLPQQAMNDMNRVLGDFSAEVGNLLERGEVLAIQPSIAFAQASQVALHLERSDEALRILERAAQAEGDGRMDLLAVGQPAASEGGFLLPVCRRVGGKAIAHFRWPVARYEPPRDALIQLLSFLQSHGIGVGRGEGPGTGSPLH